MTIAELLAATGLTANDLVPIWDAEAAQNVEPTQKVTATQLAAAVRVLASLVNTTEMNAAIAQSTAKYSIVTLGSYKHSTANAWENTGLTITVPTGHMYIGVLDGTWVSGKPVGIGVNPSSSLTGNVPNQVNENSEDGALAFTVALYPGTWYVYTKRASAGTAANNYYFRRIDVVTV